MVARAEVVGPVNRAGRVAPVALREAVVLPDLAGLHELADQAEVLSVPVAALDPTVARSLRTSDRQE